MELSAVAGTDIDVDVDVDVDVVALWRDGGGEWLTPTATTVPAALVRAVAGLVGRLGIGDLHPGGAVGFLTERAALAALPPATGVSCGGATRLVPTATGTIAVALPRRSDVELLPAWLGVSAWAEVAPAARRRDGRELVAWGAELGLAVALVGEVPPGPPILEHRLGDAAPCGVRGLLVVDLASLWAGPLCADVLRRLGARVVKVESADRPDGARDSRPFFESLHGGQRSVALDLRGAAGRAQLRSLLAGADVVIEGSRPRALEQMGIVADELVAAGPRLWVSITGHGRDGAGAMRVGFGDDAAAAGGLVTPAPGFVADAVADPLSGLAAAWAVTELAARGGRWMIDVALARVAAAVRPAAGDPPVSGRPALPAARADPGAPLPLGRDTTAVLADLA